MTRFLLLLGLALSIASCGSVDVARYADQQPALSLEQFFSQPVKAWGMFQKRNGEVVKRFEVDIASRREGENLILDERFRYSDGPVNAESGPSLPGAMVSGAVARMMWSELLRARSQATPSTGVIA